jgi:hypothetical protein
VSGVGVAAVWLQRRLRLEGAQRAVVSDARARAHRRALVVGPAPAERVDVVAEDLAREVHHGRAFMKTASRRAVRQSTDALASGSCIAWRRSAIVRAMRSMVCVAVLGVTSTLAGGGCSKTAPRGQAAVATRGDAGAGQGAAPSGPGGPAAGAEAGAGASAGASLDAGAGTPCATPGPPCLRFATNADAFRWVLAHEPAILAIGEAHAQKGTEAVASATRRFTESMVPLLENHASDLLVEAWAGDPKCQKEVKQVATAQKPVTQTQAQSNPNEYVTLGTRAKALGVQPHLLRPSCDDYARLADAGAEIVTASLGLIKRLTQSDATKLYERNEAAGGGKMVLTYGGAMHNDLAPSESLRRYSFGPELQALTHGRYVELDLIVPEYVKKTEVWEKLPWFAAFQADQVPRDKPTLYVVGERSFVLVFAASSGAGR